MARIDELPDDPVLLKRMLAERDVMIERIKEEAADRLEEQAERIKNEAAEQMEALRLRLEAEKKAEIKAAIEAILRRIYGPKNERFDPTQLLLFGRQVEEAPLDEPSIVEESGQELATRRITKKHKHGRNPLPDHLPRIEIEHDLTDAEKPCPCCGELRVRIGHESYEQLEYHPASFTVLRHLRYKYACRRCEAAAENPQIQIAARPPQPIEKGLPGPGLLAYVAVSKLGDHLPLYRLENIFARQQVEVARSTMCAWLAAAGELVRPLVELMARRVRTSKVVHTDDTRVPIQAPGEGKCRQGRIWTYIGDRDHPYIVYDYTPDRTRAGPTNWLRDYKRFLQADAYGGYDGIFHGEAAIEVACWAHARRKFFEAKETDAKRAAAMLTFVRDLYAVEDDAKSLADDERRAMRQARSVPILAEIKTWLDRERDLVLPRSPMAQAITYALNQWDALKVYVTEGFLNIDNNAAERALKRVAIGRKNWLFAGNDRAGGTAALLYSLIASAERHQLDPQRYLTSLLARLPGLSPSDLPKLLPDAWKRADVDAMSATATATS
ncbi:MAG: IS66 family transposase [Planctomycetaceae bacterium]|nr:IS66 family transposase [Planctomycetaceae bacterium]